MQVLIACECSKDLGANRYVEVLEQALSSSGIHVRTSLLEFWNPTSHYDIVHFQWPEAVSLQGAHPSPTALAALSARIAAYKRTGTKFVITRHNALPHYNDDPSAEALYQLVEHSCDAILHMGEYSRANIPSAHCADGVRHFVVPHHIYPCIERGISQSDSKKRLCLATSKKLVLAFGNFRADEERMLVLRARRQLQERDISIIAPRLFQNHIFGRGKLAALREIKYRLGFVRHGFFPHAGGPVPDEQMSFLFSAADAILIPRIVILNSGTLSMGFYFGKVVVGPDRGNVGEVLRQTGNPTFDPCSQDSLCEAIQRGLYLAECGKGEENRSFADKHWHPHVIAAEIAKIYRTLLQDNKNHH